MFLERLAGRFAAMAALLMLALASPIQAQDFPSKPIRLVVGYPAGGASDVVARAVAQEMARHLRQTVVVDNRPGVGGNLGAAEVARSPKDGYTLFLGDTGTLVLSKAIYNNLQYDPDRDFVPVSLVAESGFLLVVHQSFPSRTLKEFVAYAKAKPGALSYASPGVGSPHHIAMEIFKSKTGTDIVHVPYKGAAPATTDLVAGQIPMMILDPAATIANVHAGKIRALATLTPQRMPELPDVPTNAEAGVPGVEASNIWGIMVPTGTPPGTIKILAAAIQKAAHEPAIVQKLKDLGITADGSTPEELGKRISHDIKSTRDAVAKMNIRLD